MPSGSVVRGDMKRQQHLSTVAIGRKAEEVAAKFLRRRGYRILHRNLRLSRGEIDIVAEHKGVLVFVEVKARSSDDFGTPIEAVNYRKRKQLSRLAEQYIAHYESAERDYRFDVVEIYLHSNGKVARIEVIQDAFDVVV